MNNRDLESWVRGCSKLLKLTPFDRLYMTFYWSAIVNIGLSYTVFTARRVCIARTMPWRDVCPSVRPSHAGILSKRLYIFSNFFHHRVAPPLYTVSQKKFKAKTSFASHGEVSGENIFRLVRRTLRRKTFRLVRRSFAGRNFIERTLIIRLFACREGELNEPKRHS